MKKITMMQLPVERNTCDATRDEIRTCDSRGNGRRERQLSQKLLKLGVFFFAPPALPLGKRADCFLPPFRVDAVLLAIRRPVRVVPRRHFLGGAVVVERDYVVDGFRRFCLERKKKMGARLMFRLNSFPILK
jgi:hypothetical protein